MTNAIPFCVISSAIAITSTRNLTKSDKEFIIYESSFSDILGVIFFNFIALNNVFNFHSFAHFGLQILSITVISFVATIGLSLLLSKIEHNIICTDYFVGNFNYAFSHEYDLPALLFIMLFGLFLGNLDEMKRFKWIKRFKPAELDKEVEKFKELTIEASFLLRSLFFLLFGFLIETKEILNHETFIWTFVIVGIIFFFRAIQLWLSQLPFMPLFFIAPGDLLPFYFFSR